MPGKVTIDRDTLIEALRHLEAIVPSLDRIGSSVAEMSETEHERVLSEFMRDWHVGRRLADVRRILSDVFDYDELERLFGDVETWELDHRKPESR
jgi:hypothetical protein